MGTMQRTKGASFERDIVNALKDAGFAAQRNYDQAAMGGFDIIVECLDVAIECKRAAKPLIGKWWAQTLSQAGSKTPILIYKIDFKPTRAVIPLSMINSIYNCTRTAEVDFETLIFLLREM